MLQVVRRKSDVESPPGPFYDQARAHELLGAVKRTIYPSLWQNDQSPTRIWVVGCGAGEVVYSLATMWSDFLERAGSANRAFRVFGTDANEGAIAAAREGRYDDDIRNLISPEHLERFFAPTESGHRVLLGLRERCVFGQHDILNDSVFAMMDLIVCCSPWLGLPLDAQHRVGRGFRAALRPQRWLLLGSGQTDALPGFECLDPQHGIFQRTVTPGTNETAASADIDPALLTRLDRIADELSPGERDLPGAILGSDLGVLRFRGRTGAYFESTSGAFGFNALHMARGEIHLPLREALDEARACGQRAQRVAICRSELRQHSVEIVVVPFVVDLRSFLLVRFREHWAGEHPGMPNRPLETAIAELDARTEELLVTREELDATREHLDYTRQENAVLSAEMVGRSAASERACHDLDGLFSSVDIPIVVLTRDGRIRRFTSAAATLFRFIPGDVGRPFLDVSSVSSTKELVDAVTCALVGESAPERVALDVFGRFCLVSVRTVLTQSSNGERASDGAVISIIDVDSLEQRERMPRHIALDSALHDQRERRRIASDLHDRIGQSLALVQLKLKTMFWASRGTARATLGEAVSLIEESIVETRSLTCELSPPVLYDLGLKAALTWLAEEFQKRHGLVIAVSDDGQQARLDESVAGLLFRAVRELLINVIEHAEVSRAKVALRSVDDALEIRVSDEGCGFRPPEPNAGVRGQGYGLAGVREEMTWLGGALSIQTAPGRGTEVQLRVPLAVATGSYRR
jgi:signal transduction histidine kinase/chemotaxis methyl-accepting protein methylase